MKQKQRVHAQHRAGAVQCGDAQGQRGRCRRVGRWRACRRYLGGRGRGGFGGRACRCRGGFGAGGLGRFGRFRGGCRALGGFFWGRAWRQRGGGLRAWQQLRGVGKQGVTARDLAAAASADRQADQGFVDGLLRTNAQGLRCNQGGADGGQDLALHHLGLDAAAVQRLAGIGNDGDAHIQRCP